VPSVIDVGIADPESGIGYLRISNFQKTTPHEVDQALDQLAVQGMSSLIIDLRRNPGGVLEAAVEVADRFLLQGPIVSTRGRSRIENRQYDAQAPDTSSIPLTLLIDGDSASASELLAGALRDHRRATLVGTRTYGKGSVQGLFHTDTLPGGLRLTVSKFFSPSGHMIHLQGVDPDLSTQVANDPTNGKAVQTLKPSSSGGSSLLGLKHLASDLTLQKAVEVARRQRSTIALAP
jgi:carboxyl-terminal processing protease